MDYVAALRRETNRFLEVIRDLDMAARVPSCPDWSAGDLVWHLAEVQGFWASIAAVPLSDPDGVERFERPAAEALPALLAEQAARLAAALEAHEPDVPCYSWHPDGATIGWVRRRQAHEALIHRVDAEQAAGAPIVAPDSDLATDGVDEVLRVMIGGVPDWGTFTADGRRAQLEATDTGTAWTVAFGAFDGTSPSSGNVYEGLDAVKIAAGREASADVVLRGAAFDLDLWLWGRGDAVEVAAGDAALRDRLRRLAAETTL